MKNCKHRGVIDNIYMQDELPALTGSNTKYFTGICRKCKQWVFGQTGERVVRWTTDRNWAFADKLSIRMGWIILDKKTGKSVITI